MWCWSVLCLSVLSLQSLAQPLIETNEDARNKRQLDLGECCPCPRPNEERSLSDQFARSNDHGFTVIPRMDDCPCRGKGDSEGAASIFFPTAMRSSEPIRQAERNEEPKPLLHPEVDLATSVLQTLRDATNEEYQDALERDAARSMARTAENTIFDTHPQESSPNVLTMVMNPRHVEDNDDHIPEPSHYQESSFIHTLSEPAADDRSMRVLPKLSDTFKLPRTQPASILHKKLFNMDSDVGASNTQENNMKLISDSDVTPGLGTYAPAMRPRSDLSQKLNISKNKISDQKLDLQSSQLRNKLNLFKKAAVLEDVNDNTSNNLLTLPNNALNKLLSKTLKTNQDDSNTKIRTKQADLYDKLNRAKINLRNKEHLNEQLQTRPSKNARNSPTHLSKLTSELNTEVDNVDEDNMTLQKSEKVPLMLKDTIDDPVGSPSTINMISQDYEKTYYDDCGNNNNIESQTILKEKISDDKDLESSQNLMNSQLVSKRKPVNDDECRDYLEPAKNIENSFESSNENDAIENTLPKYNVQTLPKTQENTELRDENISKLDSNGDCYEDPKTITHSVIDISETSKKSDDPNADLLYQEENADEKNDNVSQSDESINSYNPCDETTTSLVQARDVRVDEFKENPAKDRNNDEPNFGNSDEMDLVNSPSNNDEQVINHINTDARETAVSMPCDDDSKKIDLTSGDNKNEANTFTQPTSDNPIANIKENIMKKLETIRSAAQDILNKNIFDKKNLNVEKPTTRPPVPREALNTDCNEDSANSETNQHISSNQNVENTTPLNNYHLQKMPKSNIPDCNTNFQEKLEPMGANSKEKDSEDIEDSALLQPQFEKDLEDGDKFKDHSDDIKPICEIKLKNTQGKEVDSNSQASETVLSRVPLNPDDVGTPFRLADTSEPASDILNLLTNPVKLPDIRDILKTGPHLVPKDLKLKLFEGDDNQNNLLKPILAMDSLSDLNPFMVAESRKTDFCSKLPLQRQSILEPAKLNLQTHKIDLPLFEDLSFKPVKHQPLRLDSGIFGRNLESRSESEALRNNLNNLKNALGVPMKLNNENGMIQEKESKDFLNVVAPYKSKNIFQSSPRSFETRLEKVPNNLLKKPHDLLEILSRNHEDVNDKLRALHLDLNDRIESMRNNLIDRTKLFYDESPKKNILKTPHHYLSTQKEKKINLSPKTKQVIDKRQKQRNNVPKGEEHISKSMFTKDHDIQKIKKPLVTSPKTLQSPEVRTASGKSWPLPQAFKIKPNVENIGPSRTPSLKYDSMTRNSQSNSNLRDIPKKINNLLKDSKVTISSTPQPKLMRRINVKDNSESPSENLQTLAEPSFMREAKDNFNEFPTKQLQSKTLIPKTKNTENEPMTKSIESGPRIPIPSKKVSWPEKGDSAFLAKVREALNTRLAKDNVKISGQKNLPSEIELNVNTDMTRSASENINVVDGEPLKENIGYTCKMVCTRDSPVIKD